VIILFWASAVLLAYTYVGYPLLIAAWASWRSRSASRSDEGSGETPAVTIVLVAHDEGARIRERIANLLALDYPRERLDILVASDGSEDDTVEQARFHEAAGIRVVAFPNRRGKAATLNQVVPLATSDIVLLADARQRFERGAVRAIVARFADPRIGAVSGELVFRGTDELSPVQSGVGLYWTYEKLIRAAESTVDSTIGATGAIYALRRELFEPIPEDTLLDDVLIPLRVVRRGYRVVFERGAIASDEIARDGAAEFARKVRTIAGNFQLVARERWLLHPRHNRLWLQTVSHKVLRLASPALLATLFVANLGLATRTPFAALLALQVLFYASAVAGSTRLANGRLSRVLGFAHAFCLLNWATVVAFWRFVTGRQSVTWHRGSFVANAGTK